MDERRQFVRLDTRLDVSYTYLPTANQQQSVTKDIGGGGICFFANEVLKPGDRLQVSMKLPGREQPVNFIGEVIWSEQYETIGKTERKRAIEVGVKFVEIAPKDRDAVMEHVILTLQPRKPQPPSPNA
ncbi:MAG: PilZ domain-containing protein, partial [Planctomycetes bacterium]|nr:PilZ domain-containing protein [Planctomycetota bacterium]